MTPLPSHWSFLRSIPLFILTARAELLVYYPFDNQNGITV